MRIRGFIVAARQYYRLRVNTPYSAPISPGRRETLDIVDSPDKKPKPGANIFLF